VLLVRCVTPGRVAVLGVVRWRPVGNEAKTIAVQARLGKALGYTATHYFSGEVSSHVVTEGPGRSDESLSKLRGQNLGLRV
jgi:hypothetical protein